MNIPSGLCRPGVTAAKADGLIVRAMTDRENWNLAIAAVTEEFSRLSPDRKDAVAAVAGEITSCKQALHTIVEAVAAAEICAACGGECCRTGKYHFEVADLLVYLSTGRDLFMPRFGRDSCPNLGERGCLMEPGSRPFTCVSFNCERVECLLGPREQERLVRLEEDLRERCRRIEALLGGRYRRGLLMSWERILGQGRPVAAGIIS